MMHVMTVKEHAQNSRGRGRHMKRAANQDARVLVQELTLLYKGPRGFACVACGRVRHGRPRPPGNPSSPRNIQ